MLNATVMNIAQKIATFDDWSISHSQALSLVPDEPEEAMNLMCCANMVRQWFKPKHVFRCGIINAKSGSCSEDCAFCAQSAHHNCSIETYPLVGKDELIQAGMKLAAGGATHYSIVTSGVALNDNEIDRVCRAAEVLRKETHLSLCASLGMLKESSARRLKSAGISRYHHNLETAPSYFEKICSSHTYEEDIQTLHTARAAGLEVCSGGIFGMGESWAQRVEMAFLLKELDVDCVPINFLNPIAGTRMADRPLLPPLEALAIVALFRFTHPRKDITICGGREVTLKDFQSWVFFAGANGLMIGNYLTTQGRSMDTDMDMITEMGLDGSRLCDSDLYE